MKKTTAWSSPLFSSLALSLVLWADPAFAGPAGDIQMVGYSSNGLGCPQGSVTVQWAPDGNSFTVLYDRLLVEVGGGRGPRAGTNCNVDIQLRKHRLAGFSVEAVDFRGFVQLDPGVVAQQVVRVASGSSKELRALTTDFGFQRWQGPVAENYILSTVRPPRRPEILNCLPFREQTQLTIKTEMQIQNAQGGRSGMMAVDSSDGRVMQRYHLRWQNCAATTIDLIGNLIGRR